MSRSAFASRFARLVGEPPLAYVRAGACKKKPRACFRQSSATLADIAERVGLRLRAAFSKAFQTRRRHRPRRLPPRRQKPSVVAAAGRRGLVAVEHEHERETTGKAGRREGFWGRALPPPDCRAQLVRAVGRGEQQNSRFPPSCCFPLDRPSRQSHTVVLRVGLRLRIRHISAWRCSKKSGEIA